MRVKERTFIASPNGWINNPAKIIPEIEEITPDHYGAAPRLLEFLHHSCRNPFRKHRLPLLQTENTNIITSPRANQPTKEKFLYPENLKST